MVSRPQARTSRSHGRPSGVRHLLCGVLGIGRCVARGSCDRACDRSALHVAVDEAPVSSQTRTRRTGTIGMQTRTRRLGSSRPPLTWRSRPDGQPCLTTRLGNTSSGMSQRCGRSGNSWSPPFRRLIASTHLRSCRIRRSGTGPLRARQEAQRPGRGARPLRPQSPRLLPRNTSALPLAASARRAVSVASGSPSRRSPVASSRALQAASQRSSWPSRTTRLPAGRSTSRSSRSPRRRRRSSARRSRAPPPSSSRRSRPRKTRLSSWR